MISICSPVCLSLFMYLSTGEKLPLLLWRVKYLSPRQGGGDQPLQGRAHVAFQEGNHIDESKLTMGAGFIICSPSGIYVLLWEKIQLTLLLPILCTKYWIGYQYQPILALFYHILDY